MNRALRSISILAALAAVACGGGDGDADSGAGDACAACGDSGAPRDASGDAGGPTNDDFASATEVTIDTTPADATSEAVADGIERRMDVDFFQFDGMAGQWVAIYTSSETVEGEERVDTVITLFDPTMTQIAENDDALPRADVDSEIVIRLPTTGTYYYEVQEFSTWAPADMVPDGPEGGATYDYETGVIELTTTQPRIVIDAEPGDDAASAVPLDFMNGAFALGRLDDATDVDVYSLNLTPIPSRPESLNIFVMPAGPDGYGSTRTAGRVWLTDSTGTTIIARGTVGAEVEVINPAILTSGMHLLWIEAAAGAAGTNDHYVVKVIYGTENPLEVSASNDTLATAEARTMAPVADGGGENSFLLARLGTGDVDYFSFDVIAGRELSIACGSRTAGSGILGLTAELRNASDVVLAMDVETDAENVFIDSFAIPAAGTYYLRLSKTGQDPMVTGDWARCGIVAADPTFMPPTP